MGKGVCVAGNMIVDIIYPVANWPKRGELVHILDGIERSVGGAVCNVGMSLARLDPGMKVTALGRTGSDAEGSLILQRLKEHPNIDVENVRCEGISAFTAVMNDAQSGERTFFTYLGANGQFTEEDVDWSRIDADILHVGYILLLNALDQPDDRFGTRMARLLWQAQQHGLRTSIDVVSETGDRFTRLVPPALKYVNICIINEIEAQQITGVHLRDDDGKLYAQNMPDALREMKRLGVSDWAVIHCPEGGFGLDENNDSVALPSLRLPDGYIRGTVGAGDAFCAGVLYGAEKGWGLAQSVRLGIAAAACSLSEADGTSGMRTVQEALSLYERFGVREDFLSPESPEK